uniref:Fatty-acid amide hydrolase 1 n=1 Tax=Crocodylus porosus TaxID=8502 RepID=A0A7M4FL82_CROPO
MIQETLGHLLPELELDPHTVSALLCASAAAVAALNWMQRRRIQKKMEEARRMRDLGLQCMEKAVQRFKQQNPGADPSRILSLPLVELAEKLKEGSLSAESVLYTYVDKALAVTRELNCLRHVIPECEGQLRDLQGQKEKGLLHGVPVSIKDHIGYKGHLSTCGFAPFLGPPEQENSVLVQVLKHQGAIPFAITNVPQSLFNYDCSNAIFGQTLNPWDHRKSPGGSSGGEGALIAAGGSILGFGSDLGGSIRLPSSFCGLCGLKPTVTGAIGPMAQDVGGLALCMRALLGDALFQLDPTVPPIPFNEKLFCASTPLRIGYYETDGYFLLPPCMRRAVRETGELLQEAGHTVSPAVPTSCSEAASLLSPAAAALQGCIVFMVAQDLVDPGLKPQVNCYRIPVLVKKILALLVRPLVSPSSGQLQVFYGSLPTLSPQAYRTEFIAKWKKLQLDVVLCPVLGPAFTLGYPGKLLAAVSSTMLYNVLDFPAGVVPVTTVTEADEEELLHYRGHYDDAWDRRLRKVRAVGLPVAVQCVALPWQEELCLRFMKEVETLACERKKCT